MAASDRWARRLAESRAVSGTHQNAPVVFALAHADGGYN
jgi:hypothetical protein